MYYDNAFELIGNTPLVKINFSDKEKKLILYLKIEKNNLTGSIKDRYAREYIDLYVKKEMSKPIIIPTSGNLGISFASLSSIKNIKCIVVMPEDASNERKKLIKLFGADLIETDANKGMKGAVELAKKMAQEKDCLYVDQFSDYNNVNAHFQNTAKEIESDLNEEPDYIVAGMGSSGTISGIAKYYKNKKTKVIAVIPKENEKIPGIGPGFLPEICDLNNLDEIVEISEERVNKYIPYIIRKTGILIGKSGCAAIIVANDIAARESNKKIVVIAPDSYERYLSID